MCAESGVSSMNSDSTADEAENSFAIWYQAEYGSLLRTLILAIGDTDAATEAASEAFTRALQNWSRVSMMGSPTGWTYTVALNMARRSFRRARLEALLLRRRTVPPPVREDALEVWDAVQRLPVRQRTAVALHYLSDLPQKDVAAVMGITEGTVAATLSAARKRLADTLGTPMGKDVMEHG